MYIYTYGDNNHTLAMTGFLGYVSYYTFALLPGIITLIVFIKYNCRVCSLASVYVRAAAYLWSLQM